jgi:hypothetical protein
MAAAAEQVSRMVGPEPVCPEASTPATHRLGTGGSAPPLRTRRRRKLLAARRRRIHPQASRHRRVRHPPPHPCDNQMEAMTEPTDDQLADALEAYKLDHRQIDEERLGQLLAQQIETHPYRDLMRRGAELGGCIAAQPLGEDLVRVSYVVREWSAVFGVLDLRHCLTGPIG